MSKLSISIDLCQLQGAQIVTSKSGTQCLVLNLNESRAKLYNKKDGTLAVYLRLEAVGSDKLRNEDTHFVVEPTTKEELQSIEQQIADLHKFMPYQRPTKQHANEN